MVYIKQLVLIFHVKMFDYKFELKSFHLLSFKVDKRKVGGPFINFPFEFIFIDSHDIWSGEQNVLDISANEKWINNFFIFKHQKILDRYSVTE